MRLVTVNVMSVGVAVCVVGLRMIKSALPFISYETVMGSMMLFGSSSVKNLKLFAFFKTSSGESSDVSVFHW